MLLCSIAFANNYIVLSVVGNAEVLRGGEWIKISRDDVLSDFSEINIGLNSSVIIMNNGVKYTLVSLSRGKVSECIIRFSIRKGSKAITNKIIDNCERTNISTAATRASDVTQDIEWQ
jgi:hypothetical protein